MRLLAITMATMLTFGFVSCGNDDDIPYEGIELANGEFIEIEDFGTDTTASYKLHFKVRLENFGINVTIRRELGSDIDGACGQLRRKQR